MKFNQHIDDEINEMLVQIECRADRSVDDRDSVANFNYDFFNNPEKLNSDLVEELELYLMFDAGKRNFFARLVPQKKGVFQGWGKKEVNNPLDVTYDPGKLSGGNQDFNPLERAFDFLVLAKKYNSLGDLKNSLFNLVKAAEMLGILKTAINLSQQRYEKKAKDGGSARKKSKKSPVESRLKEAIVTHYPSVAHLLIIRAARIMSEIPEVYELAKSLGIKDENILLRIRDRISDYRKSPDSFLSE